MIFYRRYFVTEDSFMKRDAQCLESIIEYCGEIAEAITRFGSDEEDFLEDVLFQNSCAFALIQIGEKVKRLSVETIVRYSVVEWKDIAKYRDMLSHNYDKMNMHVVWGTISKEVPILRGECEQILKELRSV